MSDVGSGLIKLAYRGVMGFFVVLLLFVFGVVGAVVSFAGGLLIAVSWIPLAHPEPFEDVLLFDIFGQGTVDPFIASVILLVAGFLLLGIGFLSLLVTELKFYIVILILIFK